MSEASDRCPVCDEIGFPFVRREGVPVHQNQLCASPEEARAVIVGDLRICHCRHCDFIWNAAFEPGRLSYGHAYDNTQACSPRFAEHLTALVGLLVDECGVRDSRIVEVGCGNGDFLRRLVLSHPGNTGIGFDPSYRGPLEEIERAGFRRSYFGPREARATADVVVSRHVIEHVHEPVAILELMREAIDSASNPRVFLETPDVAWILNRRVVWDFFYEHCSYFTPRSLEAAARLAGLEVTGVDHVFGRQYLWAQARPARSHNDRAIERPAAGLAASAEEFERAERELWELLAEQIAELSTRGPVALWGAGAKGVTFANQLDPAAEVLACVIDLNPAKQGGFLPGTGHPILSPQAIEEQDIASAILLNPNYENEIREMLAGERASVNLVLAEHVGGMVH